MMEKVDRMKSDNNDKKSLTKIGNYTSNCKVLGKGHFAKVIEAYHTILKVKVAIKIIKKLDISDPYVKKNFKRETRIMSKVSHPNIIFFFEAIETMQHYFIITEIGSGGDLCNFVKSQQNGKLNERRARPLAKQLVFAVSYLHDHGIVHRDLKMENILLDETKEKIKIVDFGLSNFYKTKELLKTHCGSPEYAAPELFLKGRKYGPEIDIWSLGIVLYGMMLGQLPFQSLHQSGVTQTEKKKYLMNETITGLKFKHHKIMADTGLTQSFRSLIGDMLNPDPNDRITIMELQAHTWIIDVGCNSLNNDCGHMIREFPAEDRKWRKKVILKISSFYNMKYMETYKHILETPFGAIGGIYNIEKFLFFNQQLNTTKKNHNDSGKSSNGDGEHDFSDNKIHLQDSAYENLTTTAVAENLKQHQNQQYEFEFMKFSRKIHSPFISGKNDKRQLTATLHDKMLYQKLSTFKRRKKHMSSSSSTTAIPHTSSSTSSILASRTRIAKTKLHKSTSIKMINYLNSKISQALGIYSVRKQSKIPKRDKKQISTATTTISTLQTDVNRPIRNQEINWKNVNSKSTKPYQVLHDCNVCNQKSKISMLDRNVEIINSKSKKLNEKLYSIKQTYPELHQFEQEIRGKCLHYH